MIDNKTLNLLEFDIILKILSEFAVSEHTKKEIVKILPSFDIDEVEKLQTLTDEAYITKEKYRLSPIIAFDDTTDILAKARIGAMLQMGELLKIARLIKSARIAKKEIVGTSEDIVELKNIVSILFVDKQLENEIIDSIEGENEIKDGASDKLRAIRRKIRNADTKLKEKIASYTRSTQISKYLQDNIVTVRGDRFVLPVKSECRGMVPGLIHDQSSTGSTVFIEPFPIVELNNEIKSLKIEEAQEIERILKILSSLVENVVNQLEICQNACTMLDIIFAKNSFSCHFNCIRPILNRTGYVNLLNARHPLIDKNSVVPVSVRFGKDYKFLLITGPNTGGKTVCLKTVGLFCLMAYSGLKIPCEYDSELSVYDNIFCDIGDEQSILSSLSTFSSHMVNIIDITQKITNKSLVLFDELGGGTDPSEGAALAVGIIKFLELMGAKGILTTHYGELKEYAFLSDNLENASMQFDDKALKPTFKLIIGIPGISNALNIAKNLGLNDYIITEAKKNIQSEKAQFEMVLQSAHAAKAEAISEKEAVKQIRRELDEEREKIRKERAMINEKLEKINANAHLETKRIISKNVYIANDLIEEMKKLIKHADENALLKMHKLKNDLEDAQYLSQKNDLPQDYKDLSEENIVIGQMVIVKSIGTVGEIISLPNRKNELEVSIGNVQMTVKTDDLALNEEKKKNTTKKKSLADNAVSAPTITEIKVLGLTVADAIEVIVPYIMSGIGHNVTLKIIHGKGTGALGRGLQDYLKRDSSIKSVRFGGYHEGGTGVSFAEIK